MLLPLLPNRVELGRILSTHSMHVCLIQLQEAAMVVGLHNLIFAPDSYCSDSNLIEMASFVSPAVLEEGDKTGRKVL